MIKYLLYTCAFTLFLYSCASNDELDSLILGEWNATEWINETTNEKINVPVSFTFDSTMKYVGRYGNQKEIGKYWIDSQKLYTQENGKAVKSVGIEVLNADSLVFLMNRVGEIERLTLIREK